MKLRYTFSNIGKGNNLRTRKEAIEATDEAAKGMGSMIMALFGETLFSRMMAWVIAHAYIKKLTDEYVEYNFYLLGWINKHTANSTPPPSREEEHNKNQFYE